VARAIYEGEGTELMNSAASSPELRMSNQSLEALRREMQRERIDALFAAKRARKGLTKETAATLLWMFTPRGLSQARARVWFGTRRVSSLARANAVEALTDGLCSVCDA